MKPSDAKAIEECVAEMDEIDISMQVERDLHFMGALSEDDAIAVKEAHDFCIDNGI